MNYQMKIKYLTAFFLIAASLSVIRVECSSLEELEDFPLDDNEDTNTNNDDPSNKFDKGSNKLDSSSQFKSSDDNKRDIMKRVVSAAMLKPGARQRLAQVMPILRTMSGPQRLALAALVSAQVMASPETPALPSLDPTQNVTSELMLPISMDIASMFRGLGREDMARSADYRPHLDINSRTRPHFSSPNSFGPPTRRESQFPTEVLSPPPPPPIPPPKTSSGNNGRPQKTRHQTSSQPPRRHVSAEPTVQECQFFAQTLCLEDTNYPQNEILASIKKSANRDAYNSLILDSKQDTKDIDPFGDHVERRQGDGNAGENRMCPTRIEMARPKRARATSGVWKYIVNTGEYTQTLRLEMCMRPQTSCSYLQEGLKSECLQVYNYHRLLTWDQHSGLTMDVFKVPTCCSCHVQGYLPGRQTAAFLEASPETNFISPDIIPVTTQRLPIKPGMRLRVETGHSIPKRESATNIGNFGSSRRPTPGSNNILHRGPPLPIQHDQDIPPRYPPYHNNLRRTSFRNHTIQSEPPPQSSQSANSNNMNNNNNRYDNRHIEGSQMITPNQRHPELPVDNLLLSGNSGTEPPIPQPIKPAALPTTPSRRINYSYHPIIDFFKTATSPSGIIDQRMDKADWTPITEGPGHANNDQ